MVETKKSGLKWSGWTVMAGCVVLMIFPGGLLSYSSGLFMNPIIKEFNFSVMEYSLSATFGAVSSIISSGFLVQWLSKSKNMKPLMAGATLVLCGGFALMSVCTEIWHFWIMQFVWNLGYVLLAHIPVSMMVSNWFIAKRSQVLGVIFAIAPLSGALSNIVLSRVIADYGWRAGYVAGGIASLVFTMLAVLFLLKRSPKECGQEPYTTLSKKEKEKESEEPKAAWQGLTKKEAVKTTPFYILALIRLFTAIYASAIMAHLINFLMEGGWQLTAAALVSSVYTFAGVVGSVIGGWIITKFGLKKGTYLSIGITVAGILCLLMAQTSVVMAFLYAILFGLAIMRTQLVLSLATIELFGLKDYAGVYGAGNVFFMIGGAVAAPFLALIVENFSYNVGWIVLGAMAFVTIPLYAKMFTYVPKLREKYPD